jgi:hypothetical protein
MMNPRGMRWTEHVTRRGEKRNAYNVFFMGKTEGNRPLGRPKRRWLDNVKVDLREIGWMVYTGSIWLRIRTSGGLL